MLNKIFGKRRQIGMENAILERIETESIMRRLGIIEVKRYINQSHIVYFVRSNERYYHCSYLLCTRVPIERYERMSGKILV